jgi:hypothetical protein
VSYEALDTRIEQEKQELDNKIIWENQTKNERM